MVTVNFLSIKYVYACELRPVSRINVNKYMFKIFFSRLWIHLNKKRRNVQSVWSTKSIFLLCVCKMWRHRLYDLTLPSWKKPTYTSVQGHTVVCLFNQFFSYLYSSSFALICVCSANPILKYLKIMHNPRLSLFDNL